MEEEETEEGKMFSAVVLEKAHKSVEKDLRKVDNEIKKHKNIIGGLELERKKHNKKLKELETVIKNLSALQEI